MFKKLLLKLLDQHIGRFFKNLDASRLLKVSVLKGSVELRDLVLHEQLFEGIDGFPFELVHGCVQRLSLIIPWANLQSKPIVVTVDGVALLFRPLQQHTGERNTTGSSAKSSSSGGGGGGGGGSTSTSGSSSDVQSDGFGEARRARKEQAIAALELLHAAQIGDEMYSGSSGIGHKNGKKGAQPPSKLAARIKELIQITVRNVHVRVEYNTRAPTPPGSACACNGDMHNVGGCCMGGQNFFAVGIVLTSFLVGGSRRIARKQVYDEVVDLTPGSAKRVVHFVQRSVNFSGLSLYMEDHTSRCDESHVKLGPLSADEAIVLPGTIGRQLLQPDRGFGTSILMPLSASCKLVLGAPHQADGVGYSAKIACSPIQFKLSCTQVAYASHAVQIAHLQRLHEEATTAKIGLLKLRLPPTKSKTSSPQAWWDFAISSIIDARRRFRESDGWRRVMRTLRQRKMYVVSYRQLQMLRRRHNKLRHSAQKLKLAEIEARVKMQEAQLTAMEIFCYRLAASESSNKVSSVTSSPQEVTLIQNLLSLLIGAPPPRGSIGVVESSSDLYTALAVELRVPSIAIALIHHHPAGGVNTFHFVMSQLAAEASAAGSSCIWTGDATIDTVRLTLTTDPGHETTLVRLHRQRSGVDGAAGAPAFRLKLTSLTDRRTGQGQLNVSAQIPEIGIFNGSQEMDALGDIFSDIALKQKSHAAFHRVTALKTLQQLQQFFTATTAQVHANAMNVLFGIAIADIKVVFPAGRRPPNTVKERCAQKSILVVRANGCRARAQFNVDRDQERPQPKIGQKTQARPPVLFSARYLTAEFPIVKISCCAHSETPVTDVTSMQLVDPFSIHVKYSRKSYFAEEAQRLLQVFFHYPQLHVGKPFYEAGSRHIVHDSSELTPNATALNVVVSKVHAKICPASMSILRAVQLQVEGSKSHRRMQATLKPYVDLLFRRRLNSTGEGKFRAGDLTLNVDIEALCVSAHGTGQLVNREREKPSVQHVARHCDVSIKFDGFSAKALATSTSTDVQCSIKCVSTLLLAFGSTALQLLSVNATTESGQAIHFASMSSAQSGPAFCGTLSIGNVNSKISCTAAAQVFKLWSRFNYEMRAHRLKHDDQPSKSPALPEKPCASFAVSLAAKVSKLSAIYCASDKSPLCKLLVESISGQWAITPGKLVEHNMTLGVCGLVIRDAREKTRMGHYANVLFFETVEQSQPIHFPILTMDLTARETPTRDMHVQLECNQLINIVYLREFWDALSTSLRSAITLVDAVTAQFGLVSEAELGFGSRQLPACTMSMKIAKLLVRLPRNASSLQGLAVDIDNVNVVIESTTGSASPKKVLLHSTLGLSFSGFGIFGTDNLNGSINWPAEQSWVKPAVVVGTSEASAVGFRFDLDNSMRVSSHNAHCAVSRTIEAHAVFLTGMEFVLKRKQYALLFNVVDENIAAPLNEKFATGSTQAPEASDVVCTTLNLNCIVPMVWGQLPLDGGTSQKAYVSVQVHDIAIGGSLTHWFFDDETQENKTAMSLTLSKAVVERVSGLQKADQLLYLEGNLRTQVSTAVSIGVTADTNREGVRCLRADVVLDTVLCHAFLGAWLDVLNLLTPAPLLHRPLPHSMRETCDAWGASITVARFQAGFQSCKTSIALTPMLVVDVQRIVGRYVRPAVTTTVGPSSELQTFVPDQKHSVHFHVESLSVALHTVPIDRLTRTTERRESLLAKAIAETSHSTIVDDFAVEGKWELFAEYCPEPNVVNCRQQSHIKLSAVKVAFSVGLLVNECVPLIQDLLNEFTVQTVPSCSSSDDRPISARTLANDAPLTARHPPSFASTSPAVNVYVKTWICQSCGAPNSVDEVVSCSLCRRKRGSAWPALSVSTYLEAELAGFNVIVYDVPVSASAFIKSWDVMHNSVKWRCAGNLPLLRFSLTQVSMLVVQNAPDNASCKEHGHYSSSTIKFMAHALMGATFFNPIDYTWSPLMLTVPLDVQLFCTNAVYSSFELSISCEQDLIINFSDLWLRHILYVLHRNTLSKLNCSLASTPLNLVRKEQFQPFSDNSHVFELKINVINETFENFSWATSRGTESQNQLAFTSNSTVPMRCVYRRKGERNRHRGIDLHVRMSQRVAQALLATTGATDSNATSVSSMLDDTHVVFSARNVLNDGAHLLDGLHGSLVCDTRWSDHNTLQLRIRTHARIANQSSKTLTLQLFAPDERRPSSSVTDKQHEIGPDPEHLLNVAGHSSTWLPVKFLAGFYLCAQPLENRKASVFHASAPVLLEGCAEALCGVRAATRKNRKFAAPVVCFPSCSCVTASSAHADPFILTVCAEWRRVSATNNSSPAGEYSIYLSPPLQFENCLPVPVDVVMRTQATIEPAALVTPIAIRNACPPSTGPLCLVVVSNDTRHCLHGEARSNSGHVQARTVSAFSTAAWHSEFVKGGEAHHAMSYEHQGLWTFAIGEIEKMQTSWSLKLVESPRPDGSARLSLAPPNVHTDILRRYKQERRTPQLLQPVVKCRVSHRTVERVVVLNIQLSDRDSRCATRGLRVRRFSVQPGATVDVHSCHPLSLTTFGVRLALLHAVDGPSKTVLWNAVKKTDSGPELASVTEHAQPLCFVQPPSSSAQFRQRMTTEKSTFDQATSFGKGQTVLKARALEAFSDCLPEDCDASHFVRSSQETLPWGTHAVSLWCSVWIFNTTVLPMSFEDPNTGRLAIAVNSSVAVQNGASSLFMLDNEDAAGSAGWKQWFGGSKPVAAMQSVESIKIALQSQTQWTDSLKIDTPGTTLDFFMDDVFSVGDRLQLSLRVDMLPRFQSHSERDSIHASSRNQVASNFRARTRIVTIMPYASLFNLLRPTQSGRKLLLFSVQAQSQNAAAGGSNDSNVPTHRLSTQLAMCSTVLDMDARRPLVWQDRAKAKAVAVVIVDAPSDVALDRIRLLLAKRLKTRFAWSPPIPVDSLGERLMSVDRLVLHRNKQASSVAPGCEHWHKAKPSSNTTEFIWTCSSSRVRAEVTVPRVTSDARSVAHAANMTMRDVVGMVNLSRFCVTFRIADVESRLRDDAAQNETAEPAMQSRVHSVSRGVPAAKYITTCVVENATRHIWWKVRDELCRGNSHCNESPRWTFGRQPPSTVAPEQKTRWQSSGGSAFDSGTVSFAVMVAGAELPGAPRRTPAFFSFKWNNSGSWIEVPHGFDGRHSETLKASAHGQRIERTIVFQVFHVDVGLPDQVQTSHASVLAPHPGFTDSLVVKGRVTVSLGKICVKAMPVDSEAFVELCLVDLRLSTTNSQQHSSVDFHVGSIWIFDHSSPNNRPVASDSSSGQPKSSNVPHKRDAFPHIVFPTVVLGPNDKAMDSDFGRWRSTSSDAIASPPLLRFIMRFVPADDRLTVESAKLLVLPLRLQLNQTCVEMLSTYSSGIMSQIDFFEEKSARARRRHMAPIESKSSPGAVNQMRHQSNVLCIATSRITPDLELFVHVLSQPRALEAAVIDRLKEHFDDYSIGATSNQWQLTPFFRRFSCSAITLHIAATAGAFTATIRAAGRGQGAMSRNLSYLLPRLVVPSSEITVRVPAFDLSEPVPGSLSEKQMIGAADGGLLVPLGSVWAAWQQHGYPTAVRQLLGQLSTSLGNRLLGFKAVKSLFNIASTVAAASISPLRQAVRDSFSESDGQLLAAPGTAASSGSTGLPKVLFGSTANVFLWADVLRCSEALREVWSHVGSAVGDEARPFRSGPWELPVQARAAGVGRWTYVDKRQRNLVGCELFDVLLVPQNGLLGFRVSEVLFVDTDGRKSAVHRDIVLSSFSRVTARASSLAGVHRHAARHSHVGRLLPAEKCGSLRHWDVVLAVDGQLVQGKSRDQARRMLQRSVRNAARSEGAVPCAQQGSSPMVGGSHYRQGVRITIVRRPQKHWKVITCSQCSVACLHDLRALARVLQARHHARGSTDSGHVSADEKLPAVCCSCGTVTKI